MMSRGREIFILTLAAGGRPDEFQDFTSNTPRRGSAVARRE
jgi:hypothetical protein